MSTRPVLEFNANILSFEVLSSSEWNLQKPFAPSFYVELSGDDLKNKINSLKIYDGEIRKFPHSRSREGIKCLAQFRGMQIGVNYAEAYFVNRIKI